MGISFVTIRPWSLPRRNPPPQPAAKAELRPQATIPPVAIYRGQWSLPKLGTVKRDRAISPDPTRWRAPCVRPGARPDEFAVARRSGRAGTVGPAGISPGHRTDPGREVLADSPAATRYRARGAWPFRS